MGLQALPTGTPPHRPQTERPVEAGFLYLDISIFVHSVLIINVMLAVQMFNSQAPRNLHFNYAGLSPPL